MKFAKQPEGGPEIFHTIQGEGRTIGEPAVFARLSGCNLQCKWCDTPYTWNWIGTDYVHDDDVKYDPEAEQLQLTIGEAVDQITGYPCKRVVITGGEPMQQQRDIAELIDGLRAEDPNFWVEIETNGTISPKPNLIDKVNQFNVSPKLSNSNNEFKRRIRDHAMTTFARMHNADFKFVVYGDEDLPEILELIERFNIPPERVFLMPEGRDEETVSRRQIELVEVAKANNFNLTTRLQVLIWGAKRGV